MWGWIIAAIIGVIAGVVIAVNWDKLLIMLKGKKIAVLGEREVGKTHLIQFLSTGTIPLEHEDTFASVASSRRFKLRDLDLKIKEMEDFGGDQSFYQRWKVQFDQADIVFYLFRADRLLLGDEHTAKRISDDVQQIRLWESEHSLKKGARIFAIGTHCDLNNEYRGIQPKKRGSFRDKFMRLESVRPLARLAGPENVIVGSMENLANIEELVYLLFYRIQKVYGE